MEIRYKMLTKTHPQLAEELMVEAQEDVVKRWKQYEYLASEKPEEK